MSANQSTALAEANTPGIIPGNSPVAFVARELGKYIEKGTLHLPADYSADNALKEAWLSIQNVEGIGECTPESICNALLDMVLQALNPMKKQLYFIKYGKKLVCQRSYFGDIALAERSRPGITLYYDVVYDGEEVKLEKRRTSHGFVTVVKDHVQAFPRKSGAVLGAYCGVIDGNGEEMGTEIMSMDQIKVSWKKSKIQGASFHNEQPDQACLRTVIRRRCKPIINSSDDSALLEAARRQEIEDAIDETNERAAAALEAPKMLPALETSGAQNGAGEEKKPEESGNTTKLAFGDEPPYGD